MPKKRRNSGRSRHGRGHTRLVDCTHCACKPAKVLHAHAHTLARNQVLGTRCDCSSKAHPYAPPSIHLHLQDKAIKRYIVRNIVDSGAMNDIRAAAAYERKLLLTISYPPRHCSAPLQEHSPTIHHHRVQPAQVLHQELLLRLLRRPLPCRACALYSGSPRARPTSPVPAQGKQPSHTPHSLLHCHSSTSPLTSPRTRRSPQQVPPPQRHKAHGE